MNLLSAVSHTDILPPWLKHISSQNLTSGAAFDVAQKEFETTNHPFDWILHSSVCWSEYRRKWCSQLIPSSSFDHAAKLQKAIETADECSKQKSKHSNMTLLFAICYTFILQTWSWYKVVTKSCIQLTSSWSQQVFITLQKFKSN